MALRDIDVDIELDVDYGELSYLNEEIDDTLRMLRQIDDNKIIDLTREFRKMGKEVDDATQDVRQLNRQVETLSNANVDIDTEEALADIKRLQTKIEALDRENVNVDLDIRSASKELARLYTQIKFMESEDINIDVDISGALSELAVLRTQLNAFKATDSFKIPGLDLLSDFDLVSMLKTAGIIQALPMLIPIISTLIGVVGTLGISLGVVAGGLAGIASAAVIAGVGILGFSSLATSTISGLYEKNAKLTSEQKQLKTTTDMLIESWNDLKKALSDEIFDVASSGVKSLNKLLDISEPILENVGDSVSNLMDSFNRSLNTEEVKGIFKYLEQSVSPLTESIGNGLGNALKGVSNTIVALGPLTSWMADGFENMMSKFADWTSGLKGSEGMKSFIDYVKENLPKLGSILGDASLGVVDFFAAFDTTASDGLNWLVDKMSEFKDWASNLDNNKQFQQFLDYIEEHGPEIANIISNITTSIGNLVGALSENGGSKLGFLSDLSDLIVKLEDSGLTDLAASFLTLDLGGVYKSIGKMGGNLLDNIDISGWFKKLDLGGMLSNAISGVKLPEIKLSEIKLPHFEWPSFPQFKWPSFSFPKFSWPSLPSVKWPSLPSFKWPGLPKFSWPSFPKFSWPSLPKFSWPSLPKFHWPSLPKFSWPSFPKFSWPSLPKLSISLPKILNGSHANGLGRVPFDGYSAELHKNEAVLTARQADALRSSGMLQGDGTYPTLDMNALSSYAPLADTGTTTTTNSTSSQRVIIKAPVTIHVQGGKDSESTAKNVKEQLEEWFADLQDIFPAVLEG